MGDIGSVASGHCDDPLYRHVVHALLSRWYFFLGISDILSSEILADGNSLEDEFIHTKKNRGKNSLQIGSMCFTHIFMADFYGKFERKYNIVLTIHGSVSVPGRHPPTPKQGEMIGT